MTALLSVQGLSLRAGKPLLLRELSLTLDAGEVALVLGRSGAGKSLLLRACAGFLPEGVAYGGGTLSFAGKPVSCGAGAAKTAKQIQNAAREAGVCWLSQEPDAAFSPYHQAGAQLLRGAYRLDPDERGRRFEKFCRQLALAPHLANAFPHELSGGERARLACAAALASKPRLLLADEPSAAIDLPTVAELLSTIRRAVAEEGLAVLLVTHDFGVARGAGDNPQALVLGKVLGQGEVLAQDSLSALSHSSSKQVQALLQASQVPTRQAVPPQNKSASGESLSVSNLSIRKKSAPLVEVDMTLPSGETSALIGTSGAGKSLIARSLGGLLSFGDGKTRLTVQGTLSLNDKASDKASDKANDKTRTVSLARRPPRAWHRHVQYIAQDPWRSLHPTRKVGAIINEGARNFSLPSEAKSETKRIETLLEEMELPADYAQRFPHQLSGGERQRVALARALAVSPQYILADEITSALDSVSAARVLGMLHQRGQQDGLAVLLVTHDLRRVAGSAETLWVLEAGKLVEQGAAQKVLDAPQSQAGKRLVAAARAMA